jgi:hypothetical protein
LGHKDFDGYEVENSKGNKFRVDVKEFFLRHFSDDLVIYVEVKLGNYREIIQLQINKSMTPSGRDFNLLSTRYFSREFTFLEHEDIVEGI